MMVSTRSMLVAVTAAAACFIDGARGTYDAIGKVLLVGGNPSNDVSVPYASDAIIWDLRSLSSSPSNNSSNCPAVADYPLALVQGTGAFVYEDTPMVCGGYLNDLSNVKECYGYEVEGDRWTFRASLGTDMPLARMAGAEVAGEWWLIGGDERSSAVSSVQIWRGARFAFDYGPDLPADLTSACAVVAANGTRVFALGGRGDGDPYLSTAYAYDVAENPDGLGGAWEALEEMPGKVRSAACAYVEGMYGEEIIVAGGRKTGHFISDSVFAYNLDSGHWRELENKMPTRVAFASVLQSTSDRSGFLVVGGQGYNAHGAGEFRLLDSVVEFDAGTYQWRTRAAVMPWGPRSWMAAVPLPEEYVSCGY